MPPRIRRQYTKQERIERIPILLEMGMTQAEIGEHLGVTQQKISQDYKEYKAQKNELADTQAYIRDNLQIIIDRLMEQILADNAQSATPYREALRALELGSKIFGMEGNSELRLMIEEIKTNEQTVPDSELG